MPYSKENLFCVYDDKSGDYIEIRPDADALGLVEIKSMIYVRNNLEEGRMTFTPEQALLVAEAMKELAQKLLDNKNE